MQTIRTVTAMTAWSQTMRREGVRIGFVPTMGALHDGHGALIRAARLACDAVVVSIFVNPLQFGPKEDLARYPRTPAEDLRRCEQEGTDAVFTPRAQDLYPPGFHTTVSVQQLTGRFEGLARPGHFEGVTTVVTKLLNIVHPAQAFFGQKDYQQAAVIQRLVADLNLETTIVVRPTVRESDGLALSSRNRFLSPAERAAATVLYRALTAGRDRIKEGERSAKKIEAAMTKLIRMEALAHIEYLSVANSTTLEDVRTVQGRVVLLLAVRIGTTRLLDNLVVAVR